MKQFKMFSVVQKYKLLAILIALVVYALSLNCSM